MFDFALRFHAFDIFWFKRFNFFELILACSFYATNHSVLTLHGPTLQAWISKFACSSSVSAVGACCCMCLLRIMRFVWP